MKRTLFVLFTLGLLASPDESAAQLIELRLGGADGVSWADSTDLNVMVDMTSQPGAIRPLYLDPEVNVVTQIGPWFRFREPVEFNYRPGMPHTWRAIGSIREVGRVADALLFIDGDRDTYYVSTGFNGGGGQGHVHGEFYSLDMGAQIPAERFVMRPPDGAEPVTQVPFDPGFFFPLYELTASNDEVAIKLQETDCAGLSLVWCGGLYLPLDVQLASVSGNLKSTIDVTFPRQLLRFFRMKFFPDSGCCDQFGENAEFEMYAVSELEVYGRGVVPNVAWESKVIDLGQIVNIGQVRFGVSTWHQETVDSAPEPDPDAPTAVRVSVRTGLDEDPSIFHTFNDLRQPTEVSAAEYARLKPRRWPFDPEAIGWAGPITDDHGNWSFWSPPMEQSGERPRVPRGRYITLRVELDSESLESYARMDSLIVETSPLLATRVLGEVAVVDDLQPEARVALLPAGEPIELIYDIGAEFDAGQAGFDAVRVLAPSAAEFLSLEMGDPLQSVTVDPEDVMPEEQGFTVHLPRPLSPNGDQRLRLRLQTALYGASGALRAEVFRQQEAGLPQEVESGDVSEEVGTNQVRMVAVQSSLGSVLRDVVVQPSVFTPQADGVNDVVSIGFTLFQLLAGAQVEVGIFSLGGQRVWEEVLEVQRAGPQEAVEWDGLDEAGHLVPPGVYLARVRVVTDQGDFVQMQLVHVAY